MELFGLKIQGMKSIENLKNSYELRLREKNEMIESLQNQIAARDAIIKNRQLVSNLK